MDSKLFQNPDKKFRPIQFTLDGFDNLLKNREGKLVLTSGCNEPKEWDSCEIRKNLNRYLKMGVGGILVTVSYRNYLQDEEAWKNLLEGIKIARELGFLIWIYDEDGYPSGNAGTLVIDGNPEYEAIGLIRKMDATNHVAYEVRKMYDGTHATENVHAKRPYINILDRNAVKKFIRVTHGEYARHVPCFTDCIQAFFTDEPSINTSYIRRDQQFEPAIPWVKDLPQVFKKRKGYSITPHLEKLFIDSGKDYRKVRCDFYDVVADLCAERYFGQLQGWCHSHGVKSSGHILAEENLIWHAFFYGDAYRQLRRFDLPGIDILSSKPENIMKNLSGTGFFVPKFVSSVSHVIGSPQTMSETSDYGEWQNGGTSYEEKSGTANVLFALGVNVITTFYVVIGGEYRSGSETKVLFAPEERPRIEREYRKYCNHVGRLAYLLTGGRHVCRIAIYYPIWGVLANFTPTGRSHYDMHPNPTVLRIAEEFPQICQLLLSNQMDYDILDDQAILDAKIKNQKLRIRDEQYDVIILPPTDTIRLKTLQKLNRFLAEGGKVISVGLMPKHAAGMKEDDAKVQSLVAEMFGKGAEFLDEKGRLVESLKEKHVTDLVLAAANPNILFKHIYRDGKHVYFITNASSAPQRIEATFAIRGKPHIWHPANGRISGIKFKTSGGSTTVRLRLVSYEGIFIVF